MTIEAEHRGGTGTPLLLLHGVTASWRVWEPVLPALEEHHDVIAPTLAGHRGAEPLATGVRPAVGSLTDVVERRLDTLGIERAHIAGNSLGGWIALELARRGRALSVVALSPAGAWRNHGDLRRLALLIKTGHFAAGKLGGRLGPLLARPRGRRLVLGSALEHAERMPPAVATGMLEDSTACTLLADFVTAVYADGPLPGPLIADCPLRIAWAARDRTIPFEHYGRPLLERVPGAELVMLDGVGHVPMYDDPPLIARTILETTRAADAAAMTKEHQPT